MRSLQAKVARLPDVLLHLAAASPLCTCLSPYPVNKLCSTSQDVLSSCFNPWPKSLWWSCKSFLMKWSEVKWHSNNIPILHYVSYLKNNHPHHKEAQTAENPADDRRFAQRCWAKVCRDISVGVRPKSAEKKHDCLEYQQLLPFSLASSPKTYRGKGHPVSGVCCLGADAKSLPLPGLGVSALPYSHSAGLCSALPGYLSAYIPIHSLHTSSITIYFLGTCREAVALDYQLQSWTGDHRGYRARDWSKKSCCQRDPWSEWQGKPRLLIFKCWPPHVGECVAANTAGQQIWPWKPTRCFENKMFQCVWLVIPCAMIWLSLVNWGFKKCICVLPPKGEEVASSAQSEGICEIPTLSNAFHLELHNAWNSSTL